ncbi:MAG: FMN-binding glutamate synthase family protein [Nitrosopumilus sp.]|nr:FMN-binding glutamate synthase family protein [Nitrosopumilus sp.]MDH3822421.1 FMN-binding glutamate synthase family protein [Nitrosopumilus sp.]
MMANLFIGRAKNPREVPLPKDVMNYRWDMAKVVKNEGHIADLKNLLLDAQKAADGLVPYASLGAHSQNDYFSNIMINNAKINSTQDYSDVDASLVIGGRYSKKIIKTDVPFSVAGMSYGSVKLPAKISLHLALNNLAKKGIKVLMNTGEGGALPWEIYGTEKCREKLSKAHWDSILQYTDKLLRANHLEGMDVDELFTREYPIVVQYASGRFWKDPAYLLNADGIEIKIGQGAKIGHGGILPGSKVTELVAENRGILAHKPAHSPSRHLDILGPEDLVAKVLELRELTNWETPIIVKVGASRVYDDMEIILKSYADCATVDGLVGGTGAAPYEVREDIGINTIASLLPIRNAINDYYETHNKDDFKLLVNGGIWDSDRIAKTIALGADGVGIGTGFLLAMGCTLIQECHTDICPAGITGSHEKLDVEKSTEGIFNYIQATKTELHNIAGSLGKKKIEDMEMTDLSVNDLLTSIVSELPFSDGTNHVSKIQSKIDNAINTLNLQGGKI